MFLTAGSALRRRRQGFLWEAASFVLLSAAARARIISAWFTHTVKRKSLWIDYAQTTTKQKDFPAATSTKVAPIGNRLYRRMAFGIARILHIAHSSIR
jgi:hypothetical protein